MKGENIDTQRLRTMRNSLVSGVRMEIRTIKSGRSKQNSLGGVAQKDRLSVGLGLRSSVFQDIPFGSRRHNLKDG